MRKVPGAIAAVVMPAAVALKDRGYDMRQALGSLAAGGTLGILIPPGVAMLVYGSITNNSIGRLFVAGIVPGILLTLLFMAYIAAASRGRTGAGGRWRRTRSSPSARACACRASSCRRR